MRRHSMPASHGGEVNVTPLIDVVMCLIIFFMLVTKIGVSKGADQKVKLPDSPLGRKIKDMGSTIILNVTPPLGASTAAVGSEEPQVTTLLGGKVTPIPLIQGDGPARKYPLREVLVLAHATYPNLQVIIRGDAGMQYRFLAPVLVEAANAGAPSVNFSTKPQMEAVATQ